MPLFGRAARENQLDVLRTEREKLAERFATLSFDVQKIQRLHQSFSRFIGGHIGVAFEPDPEAAIRLLNARRNEVERELSNDESENQHQRQQFDQAKEGVAQLNRLLPRVSLLLDDRLQDRHEEIQENWQKRSKPRALCSSTEHSSPGWSLSCRCCKAIRNSMNS